MKIIGLIINPIAGMGGRVGLKGTDGKDILEKAIELGAEKEAPNKAIKALSALLPLKDEILVLTSSADMGENQCRCLGFNYEVIYTTKESTDSLDTLEAAKIIEERGADLIIFVGGDGTARDIYKAVENKIVAIGVPAGVKIHSPVYANSPEKAGELALSFLTDNKVMIKEEEVLDLDEDAYRKNIVSTKLYGYLKIPYRKEFLQNKKAPTPLSEKDSQKAIALDIIDNMLEDCYYIIAPGTTTRAILDELGLECTLLGVDIIKNKKSVKLDCNENDILNILSTNTGKVIITPTGGQGYLLGRGNQQISYKVLNKIGRENLIIISANQKIINLRGNSLLIYTGNEETDKLFSGYYRVKIGYGMDLMYRVSIG